MSEITARDRFRGCLLGLAVGDALGTTLEFKKPGAFRPIEDMVGGGPFSLKPGQWTDDTSMALCLAASLIERGGFDPMDQMRRYVRWWHGGYLSSVGYCFDIGLTVRGALQRFEHTGDSYSGSTEAMSAGQRLAHATGAGPNVLRRRRKRCHRPQRRQLEDHPRSQGSGRCLPLLRRPAGWCVERRRQRHAPLLSVLPSGRYLGKMPVV